MPATKNHEDVCSNKCFKCGKSPIGTHCMGYILTEFKEYCYDCFKKVDRELTPKEQKKQLE